jgi:predicted nucleotidyltransferase
MPKPATFRDDPVTVSQPRSPPFRRRAGKLAFPTPQHTGTAMLSDSTIRHAAERLALTARSPLKVILFGSYARGEAREDSDLDLLIVEKDIPDPTGEYLRLREVVGTLGVGVDLLLYPEREFERRRDWCSTPVYWAIREGKVLYDAAP